jgi:hypothetical protein
MRTYRLLLVMVMEEFVMQSVDFLCSSNQSQGDFKKAVEWLKSLPEEICPEVTDDMIAKGD